MAETIANSTLNRKIATTKGAAVAVTNGTTAKHSNGSVTSSDNENQDDHAQLSSPSLPPSPLTVKDRMFLAIDKSAHLFTQTLTATPLLLSPEDDSTSLHPTTIVTNSINNSCLLTTSSSSESVAVNNDTSATSASSTKKKRVKKSKKNSEKENISVKSSSFNKFDNLAKKNILHARSDDADKAKEKFNGTNSATETIVCKQCSKSVFQMELVKAERANWHRNCFRCFECNKLLSGDNYESHEGKLYCKPHFKNLFVPKAIEEIHDDAQTKQKRPELIIRENQPLELPPDVVRASNKSDLGLDELHSLNVKEKFQKFEKSVIASQTCEEPLVLVPTAVKRSASILSKLAKFQAKGFDVGIPDEELNGIAITLSEDEDEDDGDDDVDGFDDDDDDVKTNVRPNTDAIDSDDRDSGNGGDEINCSNTNNDDGPHKKKRKQRKREKREKPFVFNQMDDMRKKWESGQNGEEREERREERKQELQTIRNRLFHGKQVRMKEAYQQAIENSCSGAKIKKTSPITPDEVSEARAQDLREIFERGETMQPKLEAKLNEDLAVFEAGFSKQSRSLFLELDACASKNNDSATVSPRTPRRQINTFATSSVAAINENGNSVVKHNETMEDVQIETAEISNKFKFFETYQEPARPKKQFRITPPREGQVKMDVDEEELKQMKQNPQTHEDPVIAKETLTATRMLNVFRKMEEDVSGQQQLQQHEPPPLKRFTPPRDGKANVTAAGADAVSSSSEDETDDDEDENDEGEKEIVSTKASQDPGLAEAQKAARAKQLRAKFEKWELNEVEKSEKSATAFVAIDERSENDAQIESTKVLRAKFENLTDSKQNQKPKIKVNRFV